MAFKIWDLLRVGTAPICRTRADVQNRLIKRDPIILYGIKYYAWQCLHKDKITNMKYSTPTYVIFHLASVHRFVASSIIFQVFIE